MPHRARVPSASFPLPLRLPPRPNLARLRSPPRGNSPPARAATQDWQALFSIAESGDPEAQYRLGTIYEYGKLLPLDMQKAAFWFQKSADQGYAPAEYFLCGQRAGSDNLEHERCLWRGAESGVPEAQLWLGVAFRDHLWFGVTDEVEVLKVDSQSRRSRQRRRRGRTRFPLMNGVLASNRIISQAVLWLRRAAEHVPDRDGAGRRQK